MADSINLGARKTTGRARADVKDLYIKLYTNGEEPMFGTAGKGMLDTTVWSAEHPNGWFPILSLRGTVTASQDAPSLEKINVDQFDAPIGVLSEPGDFNFSVKLPSFDKNDLLKWLGSYDAANNVSGIKDINETFKGKKMYGFDLDGTLYDCAVVIVTRTNDVIAYSHVKLTVTFSQEDKVFVFSLDGQVVAPELTDNKLIYTSEVVNAGAAVITVDDESSPAAGEESSPAGGGE